MRHGTRSGARNRWMEAGVPTIPQHVYPAFRSIEGRSKSKEPVKTADNPTQKRQVPAQELARKGWMTRAQQALKHFVTRRSP